MSTSSISSYTATDLHLPLRVDFAGGWLDVPRRSLPGAFIVNCAISPLVSLQTWPYRRRAGLGGSAAHAMLTGRDGVESELALGVGWQDPAVIAETGLCIWRSGSLPVLEVKFNPDLLSGVMALADTGHSHDTPGMANRRRDYDLIRRAGDMAAEAVVRWRSVLRLADAVTLSYHAQLDEGMQPLPWAPEAIARKYCGGGWDGYALYLFATRDARDAFTSATGALTIEPYLKATCK